MKKTIVGVHFQNSRNEKFGGKAYHYFSVIPLEVGDMVIAPTKNGESIAQVCEVDMPECMIPLDVLPKLRTITKMAEPEDDQK